MEITIIRWIALSLFMGVMLTSCMPGEQKTDIIENGSVAAGEPFEQTEQEHYKELRAFRDESYAIANVNDLMLAELKTRTAGQNAAVRAEYQARINNLEEWNDNMKERLANYREDEDSNWDAFITEFQQDMDALGQAIYNLSYMETNSRELSSSKSAQEPSI